MKTLEKFLRKPARQYRHTWRYDNNVDYPNWLNMAAYLILSAITCLIAMAYVDACAKMHY